MGEFLESPEGQNIVWMDYCGYHLADNQMDLTPIQYALITKGRLDLYETMNKAPEVDMKKYH